MEYLRQKGGAHRDLGLPTVELVSVRHVHHSIYSYHFDPVCNVIRKGIPIAKEDCPPDVVIALLGKGALERG